MSARSVAAWLSAEDADFVEALGADDPRSPTRAGIQRLIAHARATGLKAPRAGEDEDAQAPTRSLCQRRGFWARLMA